MMMDNDAIAAQFWQDNPAMNQFWDEFRLLATELSKEQADETPGKGVSRGRI